MLAPQERRRTSPVMSSNPPWYPPPGPSYGFVMDNPPPSNSREIRNRAEKMRRDKLNAYIGELASLVPMISRSAKRMDKTSILRLTATHLRIHQTLLNGKIKLRMELPKYVGQRLLDQLICEQMNGFLLILTSSGKIIFASETVEHALGHLQSDLMGQSVYNIISPEDQPRFKNFLHAENVEGMWFRGRMKRAGPRTESAVYEYIRIKGIHCINDCNQVTTSTSTSSTNNNVLLFFVSISRPEPLVGRLFEASKEEYVTRHLIDGRIIDCDQRISLIAGYMTDEVSGLSAFKFMHRDDVRWVMIALRQMYDRGESTGSSCYRLQSKNGRFIYLRTLGYLEIDDQGTVESFVCINTLVSENEGYQLVHEMKKRFSALINSQASPIYAGATSDASRESVEDPQQIDEAIVHLITNLPSPGSDNRSTPSPKLYQNVNENQDCSPTTGNSCKKPYNMKLKTARKRPPSTEIGINNKRQKTQSTAQLSPLPHMQPYQNKTEIKDIIQPAQPSLFRQHDQQLFHHNKI